MDSLDFREVPTLQNASRSSLWLQWLHLSGTRHRGAIQGLRLLQSEILIRAASQGLGLAVVPAHYVQQELRTGELHAPFGPPVRTEQGYWSVSPERRSHRPYAAAFRTWLSRAGR